ncbi:hypothetical protein L7F22_018200 [Adiantum nelumboides]|nr:hypothetical protein [Adiantum nelumboides]
MATRSEQLNWQEIHLSEDEASAQRTHAVRFLVQQVEKAQNNSPLRPMLNNLMRAHGLQLLNYEPPTQDPSFQEASNEGNAREERGAHSQDDASSGRSRSPSRRIRRPLEREDNSLRNRVQESGSKRRRSPSREVSSSPSLRGRKRERERHARRRYKPKWTPSLSSSPSKRSSFSSSSSSDGYSSKSHHKRRRPDTHRTWKRSRKLQKFKEGGKSITFQTSGSLKLVTSSVLVLVTDFCKLVNTRDSSVLVLIINFCKLFVTRDSFGTSDSIGQCFVIRVSSLDCFWKLVSSLVLLLWWFGFCGQSSVYWLVWLLVSLWFLVNCLLFRFRSVSGLGLASRSGSLVYLWLDNLRTVQVQVRFVSGSDSRLVSPWSGSLVCFRTGSGLWLAGSGLFRFRLGLSLVQIQDWSVPGLVHWFVSGQNANSPKDAWDNLIAFNATNTRARKIQLKNELNTIKKGDLSVNNYTMKIKALCESLSSIGVAVDDDDKVEACLRGLGNAYKQFKTSICSR